MMKVLAVLVGLATAALLFPTHGVTGCDGAGGGDCVTRNVSVLVEYPGENGAIGMGIAVSVGIVVGLTTYFLARHLSRRFG